ncbi:MAG: hypothetical protein WCI72_01180 [archaeon]
MVNSKLDDLLHGREERRNPNPINGFRVSITLPVLTEPFESLRDRQSPKERELLKVWDKVAHYSFRGGIACVLASFGVGAYKGYLAANGQHIESSAIDAAVTYVPLIINSLGAIPTLESLKGFESEGQYRYRPKDFVFEAGIGLGVSTTAYWVGKTGGFIAGKLF